MIEEALKKLDKALKELEKELDEWFKANKLYRGSTCPVCGTVMEHNSDYLEHIMLEEQLICPKRCYHYEFSAGSTMTRVGSIEFHGHYTDDPEDFNYKRRMINLAVIHERRRHLDNNYRDSDEDVRVGN